jgi:hypothetical protein
MALDLHGESDFPAVSGIKFCAISIAHYSLTSKFFLWNRTDEISVTMRKTGTRTSEIMIVAANRINNAVMARANATAITITINPVIMGAAIAKTTMIRCGITQHTAGIIIEDRVLTWDLPVGTEAQITDITGETWEVVIGEGQVNMEEITEVRQAALTQAGGQMKDMVADMARPGIMETWDRQIGLIGTGETNGIGVMNGIEGVNGIGSAEVIGEMKTVIGGTKQKTRFPHGLVMKMQNVVVTWTKCEAIGAKDQRITSVPKSAFGRMYAIG